MAIISDSMATKCTVSDSNEQTEQAGSYSSITEMDPNTEHYLVATDSDDDITRKFNNTIGPATRESLLNLKNDGVKIYSLVTPAADAQETEYVHHIYYGFNGEEECVAEEVYTINDGQSLYDTITNSLEKVITETNTSASTEYIEGDTTTTEGVENETRREEVDNFFQNLEQQANGKYKVIEEMTYNDAALFDMITDYDGSAEDIAKANYLSENTCIDVDIEGSQPFVIDNAKSKIEEIYSEVINGLGDSFYEFETTSGIQQYDNNR